MPRLCPLLILCCLCLAAAAPPATTQSADGVDVTLVKIDLSPTLITAKLDKVAAPELFARLGSQGDVLFPAGDDQIWNDASLQNAIFSFDWNKQPLWDALRQACEAAGLRADLLDTSDPDQARIRLSRPASAAPIVVDGPVMIRPQQIVRSASVSYGDGRHGPEQVRLTLQLFLEPRLRNCGVWVQSIVIDKAEDELGHSLATTRPANEPHMTPLGPSVIALLDYPPKAGQKIASASGSISIQIVKEIAVMSFRPPFDRYKNVTLPAGPNKFILKSIHGDAREGYRVNLSLTRGQHQAQDWTEEQWKAVVQPFGSSSPRAAMIGPKGEQYHNGVNGSWSANLGLADLNFPPREADDDATELRIELPTQFTTLTTKFQFKDLPLP